MRKTFLIFLCATFISIPVVAKDSKIKQMMAENFPKAETSKGLQYAGEPLDPGTLKGFVVVKQGGIAAQMARYFIDWDEYDYRGVQVDVPDGKVSTRRDPVYTYLKKGDILAVVDVKYFGRIIYLKLITPDIYIPETRMQEKRHSRVTLTLGFKMPSEFFKQDDADAVMNAIKCWVEPFKSLNDAESFASKIREKSAPVTTVPTAIEAVENIEKNLVEKNKVEAVHVSDDSKKVDDLEKKIEAAKKEMEEAEKEIQKLKKNTSQK